MTTPEEFTAKALAEALTRYADLPVLVALVDGDNAEGPRAAQIRLELGADSVGARQLIITGYLDRDTAPGLRARSAPWQEAREPGS